MHNNPRKLSFFTTMLVNLSEEKENKQRSHSPKNNKKEKQLTAQMG